MASSAPKRTAPQRERTEKCQSGDSGTAPRARRWHFLRAIGAQKKRSAPQENPTPKKGAPKKAQKVAQKMNFAPFVLTLNFWQTFESHFFCSTLPQEKAAQKRHETRNPQKWSVFAIFGCAGRSPCPKKNGKSRGPKRPKRDLFCWFWPFKKTGAIKNPAVPRLFCKKIAFGCRLFAKKYCISAKPRC